MRKAVILVVLGWAGVCWGAERVSGVLLMPFTPLGETREAEWIGRAVQQSLLSELSRMKGVQPMLPGEGVKGTGDMASVAKVGKAAGAEYVVYGSYQIGEVGLRLMGQVLEVKSGRFVGGMKATGVVRDLFQMEDEIAEQTKRILSKQAWEAAEMAKKAAAGAEVVAEVKEELRMPERPWALDEEWIRWQRERPIVGNYDGGVWRHRYGIGVVYGYGYGYAYPVYWGYPRPHHPPRR